MRDFACLSLLLLFTGIALAQLPSDGDAEPPEETAPAAGAPLPAFEVIKSRLIPPETRSANAIYDYQGGPANVAEAATKYDATAWAVPNSPNYLWDFDGAPGGPFFTRFEVTRGKLGISTHLNGVPFTPVLGMQPLYENWSEAGADYHNVLAALAARPRITMMTGT